MSYDLTYVITYVLAYVIIKAVTAKISHNKREKYLHLKRIKVIHGEKKWKLSHTRSDFPMRS